VIVTLCYGVFCGDVTTIVVHHTIGNTILAGRANFDEKKKSALVTKAGTMLKKIPRAKCPLTNAADGGTCMIVFAG